MKSTSVPAPESDIAVPALKALVWDVDGTLAETERDGHRVAFNAAFEAEGLPWRWDERRYGELLQVAGGYERLLEDMSVQPLAPAAPAEREGLARHLHRLKNERYARIVESGAIPLREGVRELIDDCTAAGLPMGIATTTTRANVDALLGVHLGPRWQQRFACVLCADDAPLKKPDPQIYRLAIERLGCRADEMLAIEDSSPGLRAGLAAGIAVLLVRSVYFAAIPATGALAAGPSLAGAEGWQPAAGEGRIDLRQLQEWRERRGACFQPGRPLVQPP